MKEHESFCVIIQLIFVQELINFFIEFMSFDLNGKISVTVFGKTNKKS